MKKQTVHLVGMGISAITFATHLNRLRPKCYDFRFYEDRDYVGGNCADIKKDNGFVWQLFGPHIFHTNNLDVWNFIAPFSQWFDYKHRVQTKIGLVLAPLPISMATYEALGVNFNIVNNSATRSQFASNSAFLKARFGTTVAEEIIISYSERQWKMPVDDIPMEVISRLLVRNDRSPFYFNDSIQKQPVGGFSHMMRNMLDTIDGSSIYVERAMIQSQDVRSMAETDDSLVIWTGHLDDLHDRGVTLPWRNTNITNIEIKDQGFYQAGGTTNHANAKDGIRTSDYAHISNNLFYDSTVICIEDPIGERETATSVKAYPVQNSETKVIRTNMLKDIDARYNGRVKPLGRLGQYLYLDMHQAIASAMKLAESVAKS